MDLSPGLPRPPGRQARDLTPRERDIALLLADGLDDQTIAEQLGLARGYVYIRIRHIRWRLNVSSRAEIAAWVTAQQTRGAETDGRAHELSIAPTIRMPDSRVAGLGEVQPDPNAARSAAAASRP